MGIINGPLLKTYGFRKVSVVASLLLTSGITLTAFVTTYGQMVVTYGFITC